MTNTGFTDVFYEVYRSNKMEAYLKYILKVFSSSPLLVKYVEMETRPIQCYKYNIHYIDKKNIIKIFTLFFFLIQFFSHFSQTFIIANFNW